VTDYATTTTTTSTADKVLPSSLVPDRVNAVYSFISANPFDDCVPRCLIIVCVCLPASLPPSPPFRQLSIYLLRDYSVGRILRTAARHDDDYILFLKTITQTFKRSNTAKPANVRISIPSRTVLVYFRENHQENTTADVLRR